MRKLFPSSWLAAICLAILAAVVALMPVHAFVSTWGGSTVGPMLVWKSWKEILLLVASIIFAVWLARIPGRLKEFFSDKIVLLISLYAVLTLIHGGFSLGYNGLQATMAGVAMNLRYLVMFVLAYGIFRYGDIDLASWWRYAGRFVVGVGTLLALIGILQVTVIPRDFLVQFGYDKELSIAPFSLIDDNPDALRAFATLRGPNDFGAYLLLPLILAILAIKRYRWMIAPSFIITLGIYMSGSWSAWLGALIAIGSLVLISLGKRALRSRQVWGMAALGFVAGLVLLYASLTIPAVRLAVFHSSPGDPSLIEGSTDNHWRATGGGIERVVASPLGCGPGCAGPASYYGDQPLISENYYVQIAEEVGVAGMTVWLAIAYAVLRKLYLLRRDELALALLASGIGLAAIGVWLHVWSDDPLSLTWWGLAGTVIGASHQFLPSKRTNDPVL